MPPTLRPPSPTALPLLVSHVREQFPGAVYIGRSAPGTGLVTSEWSARTLTAGLGPDDDRAEQLWRYHTMILGHGALRSSFPELRGTTVACWCRRSDQPRRRVNLCHADVIAVWLDYFSDATLRRLGESELTPRWAEELGERVLALLAA